VNLKIIRLSERSQIKKINKYISPLIYNSRKCKLIYSDSRSVVVQGGGTTKEVWGDGCVRYLGEGVSFMVVKTFRLCTLKICNEIYFINAVKKSKG